MTQIQTIRAPKAMIARIREECGMPVLTPPRPRSSQRRRLLAQNAQKDYGWVMSLLMVLIRDGLELSIAGAFDQRRAQVCHAAARASPRVGFRCHLDENQALVANQTTVRSMKISGANAKGWNVGPERSCAHPRSAGAGGKIKPATALVLGSVTFMTESPSCNAPGCRR